MTAMFLVIIMGATHKNAPVGFAPIAIGLGLTLIHLISIPVTNTSVNPARSTGVALIAMGTPVSQLWLFWLAPILGGLLGGVIYKWLAPDQAEAGRASAQPRSPRPEKATQCVALFLLHHRVAGAQNSQVTSRLTRPSAWLASSSASLNTCP